MTLSTDTYLSLIEKSNILKKESRNVASKFFGLPLRKRQFQFFKITLVIYLIIL